jgi:hypothetical protein
MAAGNGFVHENLTRDLRNGITRIFMDDRSFSAKTPEGLLEKRRLWSDWSHQVGLLEHPDKTQFVGSSQRHINDLREAGVAAALATKSREQEQPRLPSLLSLTSMKILHKTKQWTMRLGVQ